MAYFCFLFIFFSQSGDTPKIEVGTLPHASIEQRLAGFAGTNAKRLASLKKLFESAGCVDEYLIERPVKRERIANLECTLPGATDSVIIVGAHFDYRGDGKGVADNWSGAALLPSLFQSMKSVRRKHTFKFVGFTEEEKGLVGSNYYARKLTREEIAGMRAMVNLDTLGLSSPKVWLNRADSKLAALLQLVGRELDLRIDEVNMDQLGSSTDSESFRRRKIPSITIHSITPETRPILHSSRDDWNAVHMDEYYDTYRLVSHYLAFLDMQLD